MGALMEHILSTRVLLAVLNGLEAEARGGAPVCLAIVNCGGGLAALLTMDGTPERAVSIAQGKAYTALRMESSTKDFHERLLRERITIADFAIPLSRHWKEAFPFSMGTGSASAVWGSAAESLRKMGNWRNA